ILIDPKRLEFTAYADIGHLVFPIVTNPSHAIAVLHWVVKEMEERYQIIAAAGARHVIDYNKMVPQADRKPYLVVIIDELADLMMTAGRELEGLITRIAQMARAAGIHMMVATQRPSVDVITGLIKVNFPSRISFRVTSKVDSRTILDCAGADKLLGRGDMLFLDSSDAHLKRVHGAYVSDKEIAAVIAHIRAQRPAQYKQHPQNLPVSSLVGDQIDDTLYQQVVDFLREIDEVSISLLQRRFRIGYNRSARIIELLESRGVIMPSEGGKTRKVIR
ncbi:MAG TPA: FtsK/SpoIIIE domain-containing protein, partial [Candidatus Limnocylindria bacterium]|nr:FtsK/SpoIIIE domain-containing protein [Candidatus Limnocylindria bacterium]